MTLSEWVGGLERAEKLDRPAGAARDVVAKLLGNVTVKDALHGVWLGHPLHPALAQLTGGSLISASVLDALSLVGVGGAERRGSSALIAAGLVAAVPTAAAGWADYADAHEEQQRVGLVHAVANGVAVACYATALVLRTRGRDARVPSILGGVVAGVGAFLGGHMSFRQALGPNQSEAVPHTGPGDWQPLGPLARIPDATPVRRYASDTPVLVVRDGDAVTVLSNQCPHLSAPMHEGELDCSSDLRITCPWHGSVFRVADGSVVHGPATAPLPGFESRVVDGVLEARVRTFPGVPAG